MRYKWSKQSCRDTAFGVLPIFEKEKPDEVALFYTGDVVKSENRKPRKEDRGNERALMREYPTVKDDERPKPNNLEYIKELIKIKTKKRPIHISTIKYDLNASSIKLMNVIRRKVLDQHKDEEVMLVLDLTNSFRSIPFSMFMICNLIEQEYPKLTLSAAYYWQIMPQKYTEENESGTKLDVYRSVNLLKTYHANRIAAQLEQFQKTLQMPDIVFDYSVDENENLKNLFYELSEVSKQIQYVNIENLQKHISSVLNILDDINNWKENELRLPNDFGYIDPYLNAIQKTFQGMYCEDKAEMSILIAKELLEKGQMQISITFLEAIYHTLLIDLLLNYGLDSDLLSSPDASYAAYKNCEKILLRNEIETILVEQNSALEQEKGKLKILKDKEPENRKQKNDNKDQICRCKRNIKILISIYNVCNAIRKNTEMNGKSFFNSRKIDGKKMSDIIQKFRILRNPIDHGTGGEIDRQKVERFIEVLRIINNDLVIPSKK